MESVSTLYARMNQFRVFIVLLLLLFITGINTVAAKEDRDLESGLITSVDKAHFVSVMRGTQLSEIPLQDMVWVTLADGSRRQVYIDGSTLSGKYSPMVPGSYRLKADILLEDWMENRSKTKVIVPVYIEKAVTVSYDDEVIVNRGSRKWTSLNTSKGQTIYGFDKENEFLVTSSSSIRIDLINKVDGKGSIMIEANEPVDVVGTNSKYYTVEMAGNLGDDMAQMENIEYNIYIREKGQIDYMLMRFYTDDSDYCFFESTLGEWELVTGWNKIRRSVDDFTYQNWADPNAVDSWENITRMEFFVVYRDGKHPEVGLDELRMNVKGKTKILFTFDDAWKDVLTNAYPIMEQKGFKGTAWVNRDPVVYAYSDEFMTSDELDYIYANGWDLGNHTEDHPDIISNLSNESLVHQYLGNQKWLMSKGWKRGAKHVCYPSGQYSERLISILKGIGVKTARTTVHGIEPTGTHNIYKLKTVAVGRDTQFDKYVYEEIDRAVNTGSSLFFMLHRVEDHPEPDDGVDNYGQIAVSTENFQELVDYVAAYVDQGQAEVVTISEWYKAYKSKN